LAGETDKMHWGMLNSHFYGEMLAIKCRYFEYKTFVADRFPKKFKGGDAPLQILLVVQL
jgi:hypothetical protein